MATLDQALDTGLRFARWPGPPPHETVEVVEQPHLAARYSVALRRAQASEYIDKYLLSGNANHRAGVGAAGGAPTEADASLVRRRFRLVIPVRVGVDVTGALLPGRVGIR